MVGKALVLLAALIFSLTGFPGPGSASGKTQGPQNDVFFLYQPGFPASETANFGKASTVYVTADAAVLLDACTGQVLYAKNPHQRRPIASTTKIMTALLAIECGDLNQVVRVSPRAAGVEGSSIYLGAGEKLTLEELVYGALMHSGNDACVAISEHIAPREDIFVQWMNRRAVMLGLKNTTFMNTNGLPHKDHLSTAYDLAVIAGRALQNPVFSQIVSTRNHFIKGPGGQRRLSNTNQMLWGYQGANGVKTGTTNAAGQCLVSSASRDGRRQIAVVLHSDDRYGDSARLLDYGFACFRNEAVAKKGDHFTYIKVRDGVESQVSAASDRDVMVTVPVGEASGMEKIVEKETEITAPVMPGQVTGSLLVLVNGEPAAAANLTANKGVDKLPAYRLLYQRIKRLYN